MYTTKWNFAGTSIIAFLSKKLNQVTMKHVYKRTLEIKLVLNIIPFLSAMSQNRADYFELKAYSCKHPFGEKWRKKKDQIQKDLFLEAN